MVCRIYIYLFHLVHEKLSFYDITQLEKTQDDSISNRFYVIEIIDHLMNNYF